MITILGSCRQNCINNFYTTTKIRDEITYPHYTKEIIQTIEYCKNIHNFEDDLSKICFRSGLLNKHPIKNIEKLREEFEQTKLFVIEIASRKCYKLGNIYTHHILYDQYDIYHTDHIKKEDIICYEQDDDEIEKDILYISKLLYPKNMLIVPHIYTREYGKRYEFIKLIEKITKKHNIQFINPSSLINNKYKFEDIYQKENILMHYTKLGENVISYEYKKKIDSIMEIEFSKKEKTVINIIKQKYINFSDEHFWGLGDIIRGCYGLYKMSKQHNFKLIVDISNHPISRYLKNNNKHVYDESIIKNVNFILPENLEKYIKYELENKNTIYLSTNCNLEVYNDEPTEDLIYFLRNILDPNDEMIEYINKQKKLLNLDNNYNIIHFRLGDDFLVKKKYHKLDEYLYNLLYKNLENNSLIISDSLEFRKSLDSKCIKTIIHDICHIGVENSETSIKNTLLEFYIVCGSNKIKTFSIYNWVSGFIYLAHIICGVKLESI